MICAVFGMAFASPLSRPLPHRRVATVLRASPVSRSDDVHAEVISQQSDVRADGFDSSLQTTNSISRNEKGDAYGNIYGDFGWIAPEGDHIAISYVADENGYQPQGDALPTPPPIPIAIQRALEWIAAHPTPPEKFSRH